MTRSLVRLALVLTGIVLGWHGTGAPLEIGEEQCDCHDEYLEQSRDDTTDAAPDGSHESCPPGCDDCSCCGSPAMIAMESSVSLGCLRASSLAREFGRSRDAPAGEVHGVFRPPRA